MTERRRFVVTVPDWGQDHLSADAVVAFVDDELAQGPHARAVAHLAECPQCAADVADQSQARSALRCAAGPMLPSSLLSSLRSIPQETELPGPPPGLAVSADGTLVSVLRPERLPESGPPPAGLAIDAAPAPDDRRAHPRRMRFGAGAAMSGLALGALALGFSTLPGDTVRGVPVPAADRGVLGGSVLGGGGMIDARFGLGTRRAGEAWPSESPDASADDVTPMLYVRPVLH